MHTKLILSAFVAVLGLAACADHVPTEDAHALVRDGALLLDVRTPREFASGHIEGATNIPIQSLEARLAELPAKDRAIVVYCQSGGRSALATETLTAAGYRSVHDLGPMRAW